LAIQGFQNGNLLLRHRKTISSRFLGDCTKLVSGCEINSEKL
jgi:hypothetical protein